MSTDIFKFWSRIRPHELVHPADRGVLSRVRHGFDLKCLPGSFMGPLRTAPVVLLYLSPGFSEQDYEDAKSPSARRRCAKQRKGFVSLPSKEDHEPAWKWWTSRTRIFGKPEDLCNHVAFLNIGAYHSRTFADAPLLAALPSSRVSLDWAQGVLFPQAIVGRRVVICLRSARFWGLSAGKSGTRYGKWLFAPVVNRSGHIVGDRMRSEIVGAVSKILGSKTGSREAKHLQARHARA